MPSNNSLPALPPLSLPYGVAAFITANSIFGLSPLYWNLIQGPEAFEVVCHRIVWSTCILFLVNLLYGGMRPFYNALSNRRVLLFIALCSAVHFTNWWVYIWAVTSGRVLEASLGQYFVPMISSVLGLLLFKEKPNRLQTAGIVLAACGVLVLVASYGRIPWVSLVLGFSVALFPVFRKHAPVAAIPGMLLEMLFLLPFLLGYLLLLWHKGQGVFLQGNLQLDALLFGAGIMTAVPQLLLNAGVRSVPMIPISLMQYLLPTLSFLLGVFVYQEQFTLVEGLVFACIWAGIALYSYDLVRRL